MSEKVEEVVERSTAEAIVHSLIRDINGRSGFGAALRLIEPDVKIEMISRWHYLINQELGKLAVVGPNEELSAKVKELETELAATKGSIAIMQEQLQKAEAAVKVEEKVQEPAAGHKYPAAKAVSK